MIPAIQVPAFQPPRREGHVQRHAAPRPPRDAIAAHGAAEIGSHNFTTPHPACSSTKSPCRTLACLMAGMVPLDGQVLRATKEVATKERLTASDLAEAMPTPSWSWGWSGCTWRRAASRRALQLWLERLPVLQPYILQALEHCPILDLGQWQCRVAPALGAVFAEKGRQAWRANVLLWRRAAEAHSPGLWRVLVQQPAFCIMWRAHPVAMWRAQHPVATAALERVVDRQREKSGLQLIAVPIAAQRILYRMQ